MRITKGITNTSTLICGDSTNVSVLSSIFLSNVSSNAILVTLLIAREETIGVETYFTFYHQKLIEVNSTVDILQGSPLILLPGDLLYANSDSSVSIFETFVSYNSLIEFGG